MKRHSKRISGWSLKVLFFILWVFAACTSGTSTRKVTNVDPKLAYGSYRNDFAVIVDVREKDEIDQGMAAPALWMPTSQIEAEGPEWKAFVSKLSKDKEIMVYCRSGRRSGNAASKLAALGFKASNLGAFKDWVDAGLPTLKPAGAVKGLAEKH